MNERLQAIEQKIPDGVGVIDVGTDHGIIPVKLAERGYTGKIIASDIHAGPLDAARKTASLTGVSKKITFLLCDGLSLCAPDAVDCIVIAGMGGDTIVRILDEAEWCMHPRYLLVLQPMTRAEILRYWLVCNEFEIVTESVAQEDSRLYQIVTARFGGRTRLNDAELYCGKRALAENDALWLLSLEYQKARLEKAWISMENSEEDKERRSLYREILCQMEEMRGNI